MQDDIIRGRLVEINDVLITVGITSYNAESTIERALKSALAQTWPNVELVVVDDCSTDSSWQKLKEAASTKSHIRLFRHQKNKGYPAALNTILRHAKGTFVAFFDDDDDSAPNRLAAQFDRITKYEARNAASLVLCYSNRRIIRTGSNTHISLAIGRSQTEPNGLPVADYILGIARDPDFVWGMFGSCTLMARKSTLQAIGPFDERFRRCAEWDLAIRGATMGTHFIAVNSPLVTQYKTPTMDKAGSIPLKYALLLRDKHRDYLKSQGRYMTSRLIAYSNFHGNRGDVTKSRVYRTLALISSPLLLKRELCVRVQRFNLSRSAKNDA